MAVQNTIDVADAVVQLLNDAQPLAGETVTAARTFIPEFDPDDLANSAEPAKCSVFPSSLELTRASRHDDAEDHVVEIGIARRLENETTDVAKNLETVEAIKNLARDDENKMLTLPGDGGDVLFLGVEVELVVPDLLRKRVALSVVRCTYRGIV